MTGQLVIQRNWEIAADAAEVHALLCACDRYQAEQSGTPVPVRRPERTAELVRSGMVHLLRQWDGSAAATFTLDWWDPTPEGYPPAEQPARLSRLAVRPELLADGSITGVQCVRKAITLATARGADVLRAEANPDLDGTRALLSALGFQQHGPVESDGQRHWVRLQRSLQNATSDASRPPAYAGR